MCELLGRLQYAVHALTSLTLVTPLIFPKEGAICALVNRALNVQRRATEKVDAQTHR
jgi:hypothetical protein